MGAAGKYRRLYCRLVVVAERPIYPPNKQELRG
jgi:hypothetical protein